MVLPAAMEHPVAMAQALAIGAIALLTTLVAMALQHHHLHCPCQIIGHHHRHRRIIEGIVVLERREYQLGMAQVCHHLEHHLPHHQITILVLQLLGVAVHQH